MYVGHLDGEGIRRNHDPKLVRARLQRIGMNVCMYVCMLDLCKYVRMYVCMSAHTGIYVCTHGEYVCMYVCEYLELFSMLEYIQ